MMTFIANVFPKLRTAKDVVRLMSKKPHVTTLFDDQHVKGLPNICKIIMTSFLLCFSSLCWRLGWKMSPLLIRETLGLFFNTLTADDKYFFRNSKNLRETIQMQIFKKLKNFASFFAAFLNFTFNFTDLERKDDPHS